MPWNIFDSTMNLKTWHKPLKRKMKDVVDPIYKDVLSLVDIPSQETTKLAVQVEESKYVRAPDMYHMYLQMRGL